MVRQQIRRQLSLGRLFVTHSSQELGACYYMGEGGTRRSTKVAQEEGRMRENVSLCCGSRGKEQARQSKQV